MQASEWSKQGPRGTLPIIDAVNREMKSGNVQSNEYIDPTTGFPPLLTTVSGTYQYDLPDNCKQLESVFFEGNGSSYERYGSTFFRGVSYIEVPVTARRRTNSSNATVTFADDPEIRLVSTIPSTGLSRHLSHPSMFSTTLSQPMSFYSLMGVFLVYNTYSMVKLHRGCSG